MCVVVGVVVVVLFRFVRVLPSCFSTWCDRVAELFALILLLCLLYVLIGIYGLQAWGVEWADSLIIAISNIDDLE